MGREGDGTVIERVARALCYHDMFSWEGLDNGERDNYARAAKAAIEALRDPTEEVLSWIPVPESVNPQPADALYFWHMCIDAALKEDK